MTTILICGSRSYRSSTEAVVALRRVLRARGATLVIHGDCAGADRFGASVAAGMGIRDQPYPAAWSQVSGPGAVVKYRRDGTAYDAAAGPVRNARMLAEGKPDLVIALSDPAQSKGTADMVRQARAAGVEVIGLDGESITSVRP